MQVPLSIYSFVFLLISSIPSGCCSSDLALTKCDAVWPLDVVGDQHLPPHTVQTSLLNLGFVSPVRPVHEPEKDRGKKAITWTPVKKPALLIAVGGALKFSLFYNS